MSSNIDQFNDVVGKIFAKLYEEFPVKCNLTIQEFTGESIERYFIKGSWNYWLLEGHPLLVRESLDYLIKEEFISVNIAGDVEFTDCRLTNKGLVALGSIPDSLNPTETIGDQLVGMAKDTMIQQGKEGVGALVKMALAFGSSYLNHS